MRNAKSYEVADFAGLGGYGSAGAGAYYFIVREDESEPCGLVHGCPCGCGAVGSVYFAGKGKGSPEWTVIGEWPNATLYPSIGFDPDEHGIYHWHGYLRNGVFEEC